MAKQGRAERVQTDGVQTGAAAPAAKPGGPAPGAEPKRREDQTQCPRCGHFGCPSVNGSQLRREGRYRYRQCGKCAWVFKTLKRFGQAGEETIQ